MGIDEFFTWWREELTGMLPGGLRRRFEQRHDSLRFSLSGTEVVVSRRTDGQLQQLGRVGMAAPAAHETVAGLVNGLRPESTRVEVAIPPDRLLAKDVQLPLAAEENLAQVLGFEMERQTPFRADQVYFGYRVTARKPESQQLSVRLTVAPRATVDPILDLLEQWQLEPVPLDASATRDEEAGFQFLPSGFQRSSSSRLNRGLIGLNLVLLVAAIAIALVQQQRQLEVLRERLDEVRATAKSAVATQERIESLRTQTSFLLESKARTPAMVELLEELSRLLPDSTWLFRVEVRDGKVHLQGTSTAASALIAELEESRLFHDARFASPVTQDGSSGRERFHLTVGIEERGSASGTPDSGSSES